VHSKLQIRASASWGSDASHRSHIVRISSIPQSFHRRRSTRAKLRVHNFALSLDGYAAGPDQDLENPLGGGVATIQQYLRAGLIDEMQVPIVPILLGRGERLFDNLEGGPTGYECVEFASSPAVTHVRLARI
jgi:hypothetical protein